MADPNAPVTFAIPGYRGAATRGAGGPAPLVALYLHRTYGTSMAVAGYVALTGLVSLLCVWQLKRLPGTRDHD